MSESTCFNPSITENLINYGVKFTKQEFLPTGAVKNTQVLENEVKSKPQEREDIFFKKRISSMNMFDGIRQSVT